MQARRKDHTNAGIGTSQETLAPGEGQGGQTRTEGTILSALVSATSSSACVTFLSTSPRRDFIMSCAAAMEACTSVTCRAYTHAHT